MFFIRTAPSTSLLSSARAHLEKCGVRVDTGRSSRRAAASAQRMRAVEVAVIQELRGTSPYSCLERRLAVAAPPLFNLVARAHPARRSTVLHACNSHEGGGETERFTIFFSSFPSFHPPLARSPRLSGQSPTPAPGPPMCPGNTVQYPQLCGGVGADAGAGVDAGAEMRL